jgi:two-component system sensor histidine kinase AlgZ
MQDRVAKLPDDDLFLPDFCDMGTVFTVVVVGALLAFILVLSPVVSTAHWWRDLALNSLFIQWVALSSAGLLCSLRRWLSTLGNSGAGIAAYALILLVSLLCSEAAYWLVARPVMDVAHFIAQAGNSNLVPRSVPMGTMWHLEFLAKNLAITAIVAAVALRYFYVQHQWRTQVQSEAKARIQALQSRIRPHFLFNSMNTIASLTRTSPELAEQVTEDLADLFRASLGDASVPVTLERELEVCRQYLRIEEQRLGARVSTEYALDDLPGDAVLPALTLQPLAENAIYHGIEPAEHGGFIAISGAGDQRLIVVRITNSLPHGDARSARRSNKMAQENVEQRLRAFFGSESSLKVSSDEDEYTVELRFPYVKERS